MEKARLGKLLDNQELRAIITALGTGSQEELDLEGLRYHQVTVMADADVDGSHIRALLLTFFFRNLRPLIERGHVYIAKAPSTSPGGGRPGSTSTPTRSSETFRLARTGSTPCGGSRGWGR